jgi:hypothetical protein
MTGDYPVRVHTGSFVMLEKMVSGGETGANQAGWRGGSAQPAYSAACARAAPRNGAPYFGPSLSWRSDFVAAGRRRERNASRI